jgi:hypothetical protein
MVSRFFRPRVTRQSARIAFLAMAATCLAPAGYLAIRSHFLQQPFPHTGSPQLISVQPLGDPDGEQCQWEPASSQQTLAAELQQQMLANPSADSTPDQRPSVSLVRPPRRVIRDDSPTFSAVAVDVNNNEVVLQDENLFQIMVYDRLTNTPPKASMSEPKRVIAGPDTHAEFNCGLYIDPETGDIYSVNNDTLDTSSLAPPRGMFIRIASCIHPTAHTGSRLTRLVRSCSSPYKTRRW